MCLITISLSMTMCFSIMVILVFHICRLSFGTAPQPNTNKKTQAIMFDRDKLETQFLVTESRSWQLGESIFPQATTLTDLFFLNAISYISYVDLKTKVTLSPSRSVTLSIQTSVTSCWRWLAWKGP